METSGTSNFPKFWTHNNSVSRPLRNVEYRDPICTCCLSVKNVTSAMELLEDCKMNSVIEIIYDCFSIRLNDSANVCKTCRDRIRDIHNFKMEILQCVAEFERLQGEVFDEPKIKEECDVDIFSEEVDTWVEDRFSLCGEDVSVQSDDDQNVIRLSKDRRKVNKTSKKMDSKFRRNGKKTAERIVFSHSDDEDQNIIKLPKTRLNLKLDRRFKQTTNKHCAILKINNMAKLNRILRSQKDGAKDRSRRTVDSLDQYVINKRRAEKEVKRNGRSAFKVTQRTILKIDDMDRLSNILLRKKQQKQPEIKVEDDIAEQEDKSEIKTNQPYTLNTETLTCEVCQLKCESIMLLEKHMMLHFPNFICESCGKGFGCKRRLKLHLVSHVDDKFPCKVCGKILKNANAMNAHVKVHRDTPFIFMCPKCPERFKSYYQRQKHLIGVHGEKDLRYKCKHCESIFTLRSELRRHVRRSHLQEKNHICSECGAGFFSAHGLKAHMTKHTGERRHQCPVCEKSYPRMYTLREHMRIHNNDKRFVCSVCGRAFTQKCTLKGHMKVHNKYGTSQADFNSCATATSNNSVAVTDSFAPFTVASIPNVQAQAAATEIGM